MERTTLIKDFKNVGYHFNFKAGDIVACSDVFYHENFMQWSYNLYQKIDGRMKWIGIIRQSDYIGMLMQNHEEVIQK